MAETLQDILLTPEVRPQVVAECQQLIDEEVSGKSGVSGLALKGAYTMVKAFAKNIVHDVVDSLLPQATVKLEPFYVEFVTSGGGSFADYLVSRKSEVAQALIEVTDERAANSQRAPLRKAYEKVRPNGLKNIEEAMPRLGKIIESHLPA